MTRLQRVYEAAILKALGTKKGVIVRIALVEYGALGLVAGMIGSASATVLTWAVLRYGLEVRSEPAPAVNAVGAAATLALVMAVGVLFSARFSRRRGAGNGP